MCADFLGCSRGSFFFAYTQPIIVTHEERDTEMIKRVSLALMVLMLLAFVGCSKAPEAEMQQASAAFDAARTAEAEQYAPESFRVAQDTLNAAQAAKTEQ